jgi:hypothetical protein
MKLYFSILLILISFYAKSQETDLTLKPKRDIDSQFFMGVLLDQITSVGSIKVCPSRQDPKKYYYLPNKVKLATDETTGKPKFSFTKYVTNLKSESEDKDVKTGEGGGWVHFLMGLSVSKEDISKAESELQRITPGAKIVGPVIYKEGTVELITKSAATNEKFKVLGRGPAPILDGDFIAVGFALNAEDATILWETLKSSTPDVSLNFNMALAGLNSPIGAKMEVNWDVLKKHRLMNLDVKTPVVKALISDMVHELRQNGTIKITTVGSSPMANQLINKVENKIMSICFSQNSPNNITTSQNDSSQSESGLNTNSETSSENSDSANTSQSSDETALSFRKKKKGISLSDFALKATYQRTKFSNSGTFNYDLNSYEPTIINEIFGGNIGKINCKDCLMEINTASNLYTQREIIAQLDGDAANNDNFGKYINNVTVKVRKKHGAGDITLDEVRIDRKNFNKEGNFFKMLYGWQKGDNDRRNWLNYDYQTSWNFFGGYTINEDWKPTTNQVISLTPPFNRSEINILAEKEPLLLANVRAVFVKIYYKMGEIEYMKRAVINPKTEQITQVIEVLHAQNTLNYSYEIDWVLNDGNVIKSGRKTANNEILFADNLPK